MLGGDDVSRAVEIMASEGPDVHEPNRDQVTIGSVNHSKTPGVDARHLVIQHDSPGAGQTLQPPGGL